LGAALAALRRIELISMTVRTRLIVLLVTAPVIAFALVGGVLGKALTREETYQHLRVFEDVVSLISSNYVEEADMNRVMRGAMRGLAEGLDPDSAYLSADEVKLVEKGDKGLPGETGLELTRNYYLRVIAARDLSPAAKAGLQPGDFIRAINGKSTREMSVFEGTHALRGAPGSKVTLLVIRGNAADPHSIELTREPASAPEVTSRLQGKAGYIRIAAFGANAVRTAASQAADLARGGASGLVVDVRSTATGELETGLALARHFVPAGTLAYKEVRGATRQPFTAGAAGANDGAIKLPVVVLVDNGTSGAAELFAAALSGNQRATLVGEHTEGRAALQKLVRLPDGSGMLISNAWYLTPSGTPLHDKGLTPGVAVEVPDVDFGAPAPTTDPILMKGLEVLAAGKQ
jgi:carboxyl-terminal processing protease